MHTPLQTKFAAATAPFAAGRIPRLAALAAVAMAMAMALARRHHPSPAATDYPRLCLALLCAGAAFAPSLRRAATWLIASASLAAALAWHAGDGTVVALDGTLALAVAGALRQVAGCPLPRIGRLLPALLAMALGGGWLLEGRALFANSALAGQGVLLAASALALLIAMCRDPATATGREAQVWSVEAGRWSSWNPIWAYAAEPDKAYFRSPRGRVAYRVSAGVALAAGEPICHPIDRVALAAEFADFCRGQGWLPACYQVLDEAVDRYRAVGFRALKIGEEAMIDLATFSLVGKKIANVRHCAAHVEREGVRAEMHPDGVDDEETLHGLEAVSAAWLAARPGRGEMGFSMGSFSRKAMRHTCAAAARDAEGAICAFVTFRRVGASGMVLDLMRRTEAAPSGVIDYLIARACEHFRDAGLREASLSLAPLAGVEGDGHQPRVEWLLGQLYRRGDSLYRYRPLYAFKRKFGPTWQARYLLYPGGIWGLARVLLAVGLVHMPRRAFRRPSVAAIVTGLYGLIRQSLDWRHGLLPGELARNLTLMWAITVACTVPELRGAVGALGRPGVPHAYALFAVGLALIDLGGALALARRLQAGRASIALGALGFFVKAAWGLGGGFDAGAITWVIDLVLVPVEVWVIWFLLQPEVGGYLRARRSSGVVVAGEPSAGAHTALGT